MKACVNRQREGGGHYGMGPCQCWWWRGGGGDLWRAVVMVWGGMRRIDGDLEVSSVHGVIWRTVIC